ncbi:MAG: hypothetical protein K1Y36_12355 [Blastocatellia bacterium]|nr:hypothetical protein [Blastocatellia bacterium]
MKLLVSGFIFIIMLMGLGGTPLWAQKIDVPQTEEPPKTGPQVFRDEEGGYQLTLEKGWRTEVAVENSGKRSTEIIFMDRSYSLMKVKKEKVPADQPVVLDPVRDLLNREVDNDLHYRPDFKVISQERFVNSVGQGVMFQFNYRRVGKPMTGRYYFVQTAPDTIWVMRFTGEQKFHDPLRYQTDQLARTFKLLP